MKTDDIIWGGNNKCEIKISKDIQLLEGVLADIEYDYIQERYVIKYSGDTALIEAEGSNKELLDNIYLSGKKPATLVRVIDKDELTYIIEVKVFHSLVQFNELQAIEIQITDDVVSKMRIKEKENPISYLNAAFKYGDMLFVKGYGRKGASFTVLSKDRALHIRQESNTYNATNIVRYDQNRAEFDAVYILQGAIRFVDSTHGAYVSREVAKKMNIITSKGEYFDIWEAYNELDRIFALKQATENGVLKYKSYTCELTDAFEYRFVLNGTYYGDFPDGQQIDCTDDDAIMNLENIKEAKQFSDIYSTSIGVFDRIEGGKCYIIDREGSSQKKIPNQGYLFVSVVGDAVRLSRREKAKSDIITDEAPIRGLALMIDKGVAVNKTNRFELPVTKKLERKFPEYDFNEEQRKAIEVALNTPDIALILGPPGTGKTTVIKAIITRYQEMFYKYNRKDDPNSITDIPKILVSSFQHEAVENVIVGMDGNGLPSERKGGKRDGNDKKSVSIRQWRNTTTDHINHKIEELSPDGNVEYNGLCDQIYAWKKRGQDPVEGIRLLKEAFTGCRLQLSIVLNESINEVLSRAMIGNYSLTKAQQAIEDETKDEIRKILISQRTNQVAYADDGKKMAYSLKYAIIHNVIDNYGNTAFIDGVLATKGKDNDSFNKYITGVENLKKKYLNEEKTNTAISDVVTIEQCLKGIDNELEHLRLTKLENRDEATANILVNYLETIQDDNEIEKIIENYSNITAATCQQSMEVGRFAKNTVYDLVIIDEAARANPLDLLIPMSMGKQVILVGDHKQLPHMLDPEVVKQFESDEKMQDLGVLQQSMFERLYISLDKQDVSVRRTARLSKQYRMNPVIGDFASENFYTQYPLDSSKVDVQKKKPNLQGMYNGRPIAWINLDKNSSGMEEGKRSKYREAEADRIISEVKEVLKVDSKKHVGIISFYRKQSDLFLEKAKRELTKSQFDMVEIGTVDAFQGKEFEVVFLSCVRANTFDIEDRRHRVGHIDDISRLCVSFTRSKQLLVVVGDQDTVACVDVLGKFITKCKEGGSYFE